MRLLVTSLFTLLYFSAYTQKYFNRLYDYKGTSQGVNGAVQASDGSVILVGTSMDFSTYRDLFLVKIDSRGDTIWTTVHSEDSIHLHAATGPAFELANGDIIFAGSANDTRTGYSNDAALYRFSSKGEFIEMYRYGGTATQNVQSMKKLPGGNFILCGQTTSSDPNSDLYLLEVDTAGNLVWERSIPILNWQSPQGIDITADGGFIVTGNSGYVSDMDILVVKTDSLGKMQWRRTPGSIYDNASWAKVTTLPDGSFIVTSATSIMNGTYHQFIVNYSSAGSLLWEKSFPTTYSSHFTTNPISLSDNSIVVGGTKYMLNTSTGGTNLYSTLSKIDSSGRMLWQRIFFTREDRDQYFYGLMATPGNGFIIYGFAFASTQDGWAVKADEFGCEAAGCDGTEIYTQEKINTSITLFPNPLSRGNTTSIQMRSEFNGHGSLTTIDASGRLTGNYSFSNSTESIPMGNLPAGIYFYTISLNEEPAIHGKLIVTE